MSNGAVIYIPIRRDELLKVRNAHIVEGQAYGMTIPEMVKIYGLSERRIRNIIATSGK